MEIVRYLNGSMVTKDELYCKRFITEEMISAMNDVRSRVYTEDENDDKRKQEGK